MKQENEKLIIQIKNGIDIQDNYEKLYFNNIGFIQKVIRSKVKGIYEFDDLLQQSYFGLIKAVENYDYKLKQTSFLNLLKFSIWNEIRELQSDYPVHLQYKILKFKRAYEKLQKELGYEPEKYRLMNEMNMSLSEIDTIISALKAPLSLDNPINEGADDTLKDLIPDENNCFIGCQESLEKNEFKNIVHEAVERLPLTLREIINKRYFLGMTFKEISQERNVSIESVRRIERKGLDRLERDTTFKKKLDDYCFINEYRRVGVNEFNRTWTSSTEWYVLEKERLQSCN